MQLVKILAGIRRCGKSTILEILRDDLLNSGIPEDHIIMMRYSSFLKDDELTARYMYHTIQNRFCDNQMYYLLLDEVQEVADWEKAVNSLLEDYKTDIYVTGSNSRLLAGEISTYLSGRYVSIPVYPLSFSEYLDFKQKSMLSTKQLLQSYIRFGGFPLIAAGDYDERSAYQIVEDIYNSVVIADISRRYRVENYDLFGRVVRFVVENVGKTFSINAITKFLKNENRTISTETIYNYLGWLEKAFVLYRCPRYDMQRKTVLRFQEKFYLSDSAIKYSIIGYDSKFVESMMENIVFFELKRHKYKVYVGENGTKEVDFIAERQGNKVYVQVCRHLPKYSDREIRNLLEIQDNFPKYIVTMDEGDVCKENGIKIVHLADFLLVTEFE